MNVFITYVVYGYALTLYEHEPLWQRGYLPKNGKTKARRRRTANRNSITCVAMTLESQNLTVLLDADIESKVWPFLESPL